jgi:hypothetical protein
MSILSIVSNFAIANLKKYLHNLRRLEMMYQVLARGLGLQMVTREQLAGEIDKYHTLSFGSEESILANEPVGVEEVPEIIKPIIGQVTLQKPFVAEVKNVQVVGSAAIGFDENDRILAETIWPTEPKTIPPFEDLHVQTFIVKKTAKEENAQLDLACSLVNRFNKVYGHWMIDCLMRLEGLEYYQKQTEQKPVLIISPNPTQWQVDSLKLLGYEPDDYIEWNQKKVNVQKLIVPSFRRQGGWTEPEACQWLKERMLSNLPAWETPRFPISPRIYIARPKGAGRQILNEEEVLEILAPLGFVSYTPEGMSFSEEVRLFSQAEAIVATHGSGLINMIFSQKKPVIIDLFSSWYSPTFFRLSASLGFKYAYLYCQPHGLDMTQMRGNMVVDVAKLKRLLDKVMD